MTAYPSSCYQLPKLSDRCQVDTRIAASLHELNPPTIAFGATRSGERYGIDTEYVRRIGLCLMVGELAAQSGPGRGTSSLSATVKQALKLAPPETPLKASLKFEWLE